MRTHFRWQETIRTGTAGISAAGYAMIALLAGSLGYWAYTAPLAGAVIAQGTIAAAGRNVQIQHPDGGIVRDVLVREGSAVTAGQPLIMLDTTDALTLLNRLRNRTAALEMQMLRLESERDGLDAMTLPAGTKPDSAAAMFFVEQAKEFEIGLRRFEAEHGVLLQRIDVNQEAVVGLEAQKEAMQQQLEVIREEIAIKRGLLEQGLTYRSDLSTLLRAEADLVGEMGVLEAQLATSHGRVIEARAEAEKLVTVRIEEATAELNEVRTSAIDVQEQVVAAEAALKRTTMRAPVDGIVVSSTYNSVGAVVLPGEKVLEILPTSPQLIVEARISPNDIRRVHRGQQAMLRLTALNQRLTPQVSGSVIHVSADRLFDQVWREYYYTVRFIIDDALPEGISVADLSPGMPVEAMVMSDSRTFVEYLLRPLTDSFHRAFTEE